MNLPKKLIINADDYGLCQSVNSAVEQMALSGRLGGVSVIVNGTCCEQSLTFLRAHSTVSAGVHLNAIEGLPVSPPSQVSILTDHKGYFVGLAALLRRWVLHPVAVTRAVEHEWRAQIEFLLKAGIRLTHADSHQHVHALPPAYRSAVKLCEEYRIPALRWPHERRPRPLRKGASLGLRASLFSARLIAPRRAEAVIRRNDHFLGFERAGAYGLEELIADLELVQPGVTELALHPSTEDGVPYPRLQGDRERRAVLADSLPEHLDRLGIELTSWENF